MISFYFTYDNIWMMFPRLFICSSVTWKSILYLLNCKTCPSSDLCCTGQQVDTKVINTSAVLWRRGSEKERPVPVFSTTINHIFHLKSVSLARAKSLFQWGKIEGSLKVGRTLQSFGILASHCASIFGSSGLQPDIIVEQCWQQGDKGLTLTPPMGEQCSWKGQDGSVGSLL